VTGLIYVAIIALWAAVLIPIWLRRNDADEVRAVDRFDNAMHTLGRFRRGQAGSDVLVKGERISRPRTSAGAAGRRLLIQIGLLAVTVVLGVAWIVGAAPAWLLVVAVALTGAFAVMSRRQAVRERAALRRGRRRAEPVAATRRRSGARRRVDEDVQDELLDDIDDEPVTMPGRRSAPAPQRPRPGRRRTIVFDDIDLDTGYDVDIAPTRQARRQGREELRPTGSAWEAVPTTLPTYVDAPAASAIPRNIDRGGAWDADAMLEQARSRRPEPAAFFDQYAEDDYDLTHRRAAGE